MKTPMTVVASSGAELPAAINVAPATSGVIDKTDMINNMAREYVQYLYGG